MNSFAPLYRSDESRELLKNHPNAFLLLAQIALRAKWKDCNVTGLKKGQAQIGDYKHAGLKSERAYRHAKTILEKKCKIATFQGTSKGTIATLIESSVFGVSVETRGEPTGRRRTDKGRARDELGTTNYKDKTKEEYKDKPSVYSSETEKIIINYALQQGLEERDGMYIFNHLEERSWKQGGIQIEDWRPTFNKYRAAGWLPSQNRVANDSTNPKEGTVRADGRKFLAGQWRKVVGGKPRQKSL